MGKPTLIYPNGEPIPRVGHAMATAFQAADDMRPEFASWDTGLYSADAAILPERESISARVHDTARNDGWASGGLQKHLDSAIGGGLMLLAQPDFQALGLDMDWAFEWSETVEAKWRTYANDPGYYCDAERKSTMAGVMGLLYRHRLLDGAALSVLLWEERGGPYATTVQVVHPDRLSNPNGTPDSDTIRGGVEVGRLGDPMAYHIRKGHPGDVFRFAGQQFEWERVERELPWGRPQVIHDFERGEAGQTREVSPLAPIVKQFRMVGRYNETELQAAVANAILAAYIESPFDHELLAGALGMKALSGYQEARTDFHEKSRLKLNGMKIPILFPGEKPVFTNAARPPVAFAAFTEVCLRNLATAMGLSYEQLAMDWSKTNYSSARAALLEVWKFITARRSSFKTQTLCQIYAAWLEEAIDKGHVEIPAGAPSFQEARSAYVQCEWIGPGRGWVDPVKEVQAAILRMEAGLSTLQQECAEQGLDYRRVLMQRAREKKLLEEAGITLPQFSAVAGIQAPSDMPNADGR